MGFFSAFDPATNIVNQIYGVTPDGSVASGRGPGIPANYSEGFTSSSSGGSSSGGSSGGAAAAPAWDPQAIAQYDNQLKQYNDALGRLDRQQTTGAQNLENQYNQNYNTLLGQQSVSRRDYDTNKTNQLQDYQGARTNIQDNMRSLLGNARRLLGAAGAGGGSADRYAAPNAVQQEGATQNAVVQKTNARNISALDTAYDDNERQFKTGFENLVTQKDAALRSNQSNFEQQRANLLNTIADITGKKSMAMGKSYEQALAETNPYTDRINGILNTIDTLAANPGVVRLNELNLSKPNLEQYQWNRFAAPQTAPQDTSLTSPIRLLLGLDQEQKQV